MEKLSDDLGHILARRVVFRAQSLRIFDEILKLAVLVLADRSFERYRLSRAAPDLADLVFGKVHLFRNIGDARLEAVFIGEFLDGFVDLIHHFDHVDRNSYRPALIGDSSRYRLSDPPCRVSRELVAAVIFELVDRLDETDVSFADDVLEIKPAVVVFLRDADNKSEVSLNKLVFRASDSLFGCSELFGIGSKLIKHQILFFKRADSFLFAVAVKISNSL